MYHGGDFFSFFLCDFSGRAVGKHDFVIHFFSPLFEVGFSKRRKNIPAPIFCKKSFLRWKCFLHKSCNKKQVLTFREYIKGLSKKGVKNGS
jgi:hypothetical protein